MLSRRPELDLLDLIYLYENGIGLRHQAKKMVLQEIIDGGRGDALSLAAPLRSTVASFGKNLQRFKFGVKNQYLDNQGYYDREKYGDLDNHSKLPLERNMYNPRNLLDLNDENQKWSSAQIISDFQEGIYKFIEVNSQLFSRTGDYQSAYMLIKMPQGAEVPYDIRSYHGLGKCGTQDFTAEAVVSFIIRRQEEKWDNDTIYIKVINSIKSLSKDYHLKREAPILLSELESRGFVIQERSPPRENKSTPLPINCFDIWKIMFHENPVTLSGVIGGTVGLLFYDKLIIGVILGMTAGSLYKVSNSYYEYGGRFFKPVIIANEDISNIPVKVTSAVKKIK